MDFRLPAFAFLLATLAPLAEEPRTFGEDTDSIVADASSRSVDDAASPDEPASPPPAWNVSLSQWGQAGDTSSSHQTALSMSWTGRWEDLRFVPSLRAVRSRETSPDSAWIELEPSAKLRLGLGSTASLTVSGWSTLLHAPRDLGASVKLAASSTPWTGGGLSGWGELRDSKEGHSEGGVGTGLDQEIGDALSLSATASVWLARPTFPSGKEGGSYAPEWTLGLGTSWDADTWSLGLSGDWTSTDAEREVKSNSKKLLASRLSATETIHHQDWLLSLDASWDPIEPLSLWTNLSWRWVRENGGVAIEGLSTGASKKLSATDVSTIENGPSWEIGAGWSW